MNAGHTVRSDTKHQSSSHVSTRLWNLPAYGKPLRNAPFHRPWKTPPIHRPRFPQLPQPLPLQEKKPEPDEESGSSSSTHDSHIAWYENRGHVSKASLRLGRPCHFDENYAIETARVLLSSDSCYC